MGEDREGKTQILEGWSHVMRARSELRSENTARWIRCFERRRRGRRRR
jgi:hypothetical protein